MMCNAVTYCWNTCVPLQVHFDMQDPFTAATSTPTVLFCTSGGLLGSLSTATAVRMHAVKAHSM